MVINVRLTQLQWLKFALLQKCAAWCKNMRACLGAAHERSSWWPFVWSFRKEKPTWIRAFIAGKHQFSPLRQYLSKNEKGDVVEVWEYLDRLMIHLILGIIRPTFKHIISPLCLHLKGPAVIKKVTAAIKAALNTGKFQYCLRLDIKSFYASIDRGILLTQLIANFDDPRLLHYFEAIVNTAIDKCGNVFVPKFGIPRGSALSPFFAALYLTALDRAFENRHGVFYRCYMDDIIILVENKRQYAKARKRVVAILKELKLQLSSHKSYMGRLQHGFNFLGVSFAVTRIPQEQTQVATVELYNRTYRRALDKVQALLQNAVHPANIQSYLSRWGTWWYPVAGLKKYELIHRWLLFAECCKQQCKQSRQLGNQQVAT